MAVSEAPPRKFTPSQRVVLRRLEANRRKLERLNEVLEALEAARGDLYLAARSADPPVTYADIANVYGVTEAAIIQKVKRHLATGDTEATRDYKARLPKVPKG